MSVISDVAKKLFDLQDVSCIAVHLKAENYFDTLRATIDNFAAKNKLHSIYVTFTIPSQSIISALEALEVSLTKVHFIDGISNIMMSAPVRTEKTVFIESPTMLEYVMLKIEFILRKIKDELDTEDQKARSLGLTRTQFAFHGIIKRELDGIGADKVKELSVKVVEEIESLAVVEWVTKQDIQRRMRKKIKRTLRASDCPTDKIEPLTHNLLDLARDVLKK